MKRLDQLARGFIVAGVNRIENRVDEFRAEAVFLVDRAAVRRIGFGEQVGRDAVIVVHDAPFPVGGDAAPPMEGAALAQPSPHP